MTRSLAVAAALVVVWAAQAPAQTQAPAQQKSKPTLLQRLSAAPTPARVHRLEVYNGPLKTVKFYGENMTNDDMAILRELGDSQTDPHVVVPVAAPLEPVAAPSDRAPPVDSREVREHRYYLASAYAAGSPKLRQAFNLPEPPAPKKSKATPGIRPAVDGDLPPPVAIVTVRETGERLMCAKFEVNGTWINLTLTNGKTARFKAADLLRIEDPTRK
jgi:hypothetical protein